MEKRCDNCSHWETDELFDESTMRFAGYCKLVTRVTKLTFEDDVCKKHRFKRGTKK